MSGAGILLPLTHGQLSLLHWLGDSTIAEMPPRFECTYVRAALVPGTPPEFAGDRGENVFGVLAEDANCVAIAAWS